MNELQVSSRGSLSIRDLRKAVARNRLLLVAPIIGCVLLAGAVSILMRPTYESEASIRINSTIPGASLLEDEVPMGGLGLLGLGENEVDTDITILRSRRIVDAVVDSLGLHVLLLSPDTLRSEVLEVIDAPPESVEGTYELRRTAEGSYELHSVKVRQPNGRYTRSMERARELIHPPATIEIGRPFEMGGMTLALSPSLASTQPEEVTFKVRPFNRYVERVRENDLRVRRVDRGKVVRVEYRYPDPELAAAAVNGITEEFVNYELSTGTSDAASTVRVLQEQVAMYDAQLRDAEARLKEFQEEQLVIVPEEQATLQMERAAELQVALDAAVVERQALSNVLESARQEAASDGESPYRRLATFPGLVANGAIEGLLQSVIRLEDERSALLLRRTPSNTDVRSLDTRIAALELQLYQLGQSYLASLDEQISSTTKALSDFDAELRTLPAREVEFARLTRERMLLGEVYVLLQQRLVEAEVLAAIDNETGTVRIVDQGIVPVRPVFPNPPVYLALGGVLGLMLGIMAVVGRESLSTAIRSSSDAERVLDGVPVLATIPALERDQIGEGKRKVNRTTLPLGRLSEPSMRRNGGPPLLTSGLRDGRRADAYRSLQTSIAFSGTGESPKVIVVANLANNGTPDTVAASLAVTLARTGRRTLLVDCDMGEDRALHPLFGVPSSGGAGFAGILSGGATLDDAVQLIELDDAGALFVLASGGDQPHAFDLLNEEAVRSAMATFRERYDAIVLDAPSLGGSLDAAILGREADATIICVRTGETDQEDLQEATSRLQRLQVPLTGVVLSEG